jgi:two-component system, LytTR family, response regulator
MITPIRALIVDDEPLARRRLKRLLRTASDVVIVGEAASGEAAVAEIAAQRPDLLFLDIQLPELDGFEVLTAVDDRRPPVVVFTTAYSEHAVRAFDRHALDYLLKPIEDTRLQETLRRTRATLSQHDASGVPAALAKFLADWQTRAGYLERLAVRDRGRIRIVRIEAIDWLESADNYVSLHAGRRTYLVRHTIKALETKLDPAKFLRIRRSIIVNADRIVELRPESHGEQLVVLRDGTTLSSTRTHAEALRAFLARLE